MQREPSRRSQPVLLAVAATGLAEVEPAIGAAGFVVSHVDSQKAMVAELESGSIDLVLVDLAERQEAWDTLRLLRRRGFSGGILALSDSQALEDRLTALRLGAQDFLIKPFTSQELCIRLQTLLALGGLKRSDGARRRKGASSLNLDIRRRQVTVDGVTTRLTPSETLVLDSLLRRPGDVVSKQEILDRMYPGKASPSKNTIEVMISSLRRKLHHGEGSAEIKTLWGSGYYLETTPPP